MGGQSSRLVKEIIEDSMYIIRQTDRQTYERTLSAHAEVQNKIQELEHIKKKMLDSKEQVAQRAQLYQAFENAGIHKKQLDQATEGFIKQFELPKEYLKIASSHREKKKKQEKEKEKSTKINIYQQEKWQKNNASNKL